MQDAGNERLYFSDENLSLYLKNQIFQFRCLKCKNQLFTNNLLEGILLSLDDTFYMFIDPKKLDIISLTLNSKEDIQFKDNELKEEDCIFHSVKCKNCDVIIGKFFIATPIHKNFFKDKIIISLKNLFVEQIVISENEFAASNQVDLGNIIRNITKQTSFCKQGKNEDFKNFKERAKILYSLTRNHNELFEFKKDVIGLNNDFQKLCEIADYLKELENSNN